MRGAGAPSDARLWNRSYSLYLVGSIVGWGGLAIADVVFLFLVYSETGSAIAVAYVGIVEALPPIAIGLPAGIVADRYDRRRVLVVTSLLQAGALALVFLDLRRFGFNLSVLLVLLFALETVTVVFRPSANALLPELVASPALEDANGVAQGATSVASTVGSAAAAVLLVLAGSYPTIAADGLLLLLAALLFAGIGGRRPPVRATSMAPSLGRELREAFDYLRGQPALVQLTAVTIATGFFVEMVSPFLVVYTVRVLGEADGSFGYLLAGFSAGFFVGSLAVGRLGILPSYGRFLAAAVSGSGVLLTLLVLVPNFGLALGALTGVGMLLGLLVTGFTVLVQRLVPSALLGRYLGLDETLTWTVAPLGILAGGVLAETVGVSVAFAVAGVGLIATGAVAYALKDLRTIEVVAGPPFPIVPAGVLGEEFVGLPLTGQRLAQAGPEPAPVPDEVGP